MLTTEKEVFEEVKRRLLLEDNDDCFICNNIESMREDELINESLFRSCMSLMRIHKPVDNEFTEHKYWFGIGSWWSTIEAEENNEMHLVIQEKIKFLDYLISKLD